MITVLRTRSARRGIVLALALVLGGSCASRSDKRGGALQGDAGADARVADGPVTQAGGAPCQSGWKPATFGTPWWVTSPPATCSERVAHDPPQPGDPCDMKEWGNLEPAGCNVPPMGLYCSGAVVIMTCYALNDCPEDMACSNGATANTGYTMNAAAGGDMCIQKCAGAQGGNGPCAYCDQACNSSGLCGAKPVFGPSCANDCDCQAWQAMAKCASGVCVPPELGDEPPRGNAYCIQDCQCAAGATCRPPGCCTNPDGSKAALISQQCTPDGGAIADGASAADSGP
jgi:hypothetical protein